MKLNLRLRDLEKRVMQAEKAAPSEDVGQLLAQAVHETRLILFALAGKGDAKDSAGAADFECTLAACSPPVVRVVREMMGMRGFSHDYLKELRARLKSLSATEIKTIEAYRERASVRDFQRRNQHREQSRQVMPVEMGTPLDRRGL
jgi:hypothetical protein